MKSELTYKDLENKQFSRAMRQDYIKNFVMTLDRCRGNYKYLMKGLPRPEKIPKKLESQDGITEEAKIKIKDAFAWTGWTEHKLKHWNESRPYLCLQYKNERWTTITYKYLDRKDQDYLLFLNIDGIVFRVAGEDFLAWLDYDFKKLYDIEDLIDNIPTLWNIIEDDLPQWQLQPWRNRIEEYENQSEQSDDTDMEILYTRDINEEYLQYFENAQAWAPQNQIDFKNLKDPYICIQFYDNEWRTKIQRHENQFEKKDQTENLLFIDLEGQVLRVSKSNLELKNYKGEKLYCVNKILTYPGKFLKYLENREQSMQLNQNEPSKDLHEDPMDQFAQDNFFQLSKESQPFQLRCILKTRLGVDYGDFNLTDAKAWISKIPIDLDSIEDQYMCMYYKNGEWKTKEWEHTESYGQRTSQDVKHLNEDAVGQNAGNHKQVFIDVEGIMFRVVDEDYNKSDWQYHQGERVVKGWNVVDWVYKRKRSQVVTPADVVAEFGEKDTVEIQQPQKEKIQENQSEEDSPLIKKKLHKNSTSQSDKSSSQKKQQFEEEDSISD